MKTSIPNLSWSLSDPTRKAFETVFPDTSPLKTSRANTRPNSARTPRTPSTRPQSARVVTGAMNATVMSRSPMYTVTASDVAVVCCSAGSTYMLAGNGESLWIFGEQSILALSTRYSDHIQPLIRGEVSACVVENIMYLYSKGMLMNADVSIADKTFFWDELMFDVPLPKTEFTFSIVAACEETRAILIVTDISIIICKPKRKMWTLTSRGNGPAVLPQSVITHSGHLFAYSNNAVYRIHLDSEQVPWEIILLPESLMDKGPPRNVVFQITSDVEMIHVWSMHTDAVTRSVVSQPFTACSVVDTIPNTTDIFSEPVAATFLTFLGGGLLFVDAKIHVLNKRAWQPVPQCVRARSFIAKTQFPRPPSAPIQVPSDPRCGRVSVVTMNIKTDSSTSFRRNVKALLCDTDDAVRNLQAKEVTFDVQGSHPHNAQVSIGCRNTVPTEVRVMVHTTTDELSSAINVDFLDASRKLRIRFCQKIQLSDAARLHMETDRRKIEERWVEVRNTEKELEDYRAKLMLEWGRLQETESKLNDVRVELDATKVSLKMERDALADEKTEIGYLKNQLEESLENDREHEKEAEKRRRQEKEKTRLFERDQENEKKKLEKMENQLQRKIQDQINEAGKLEVEQQRMGRERESYKRDMSYGKEKEDKWEFEKTTFEKKTRILQEEATQGKQTQVKLEEDMKKLQEQDKNRRDQLAAFQLRLDYSEGRGMAETDFEWSKRREANNDQEENIKKARFLAPNLTMEYSPAHPVIYIQGSSEPENVCSSVDVSVDPNHNFVSGVVECEICEGYMVGDTITVDEGALATVGAQVVPSNRDDVVRIEFTMAVEKSLSKLFNAVLTSIHFSTQMVSNAFLGIRKVEIFIQLSPAKGIITSLCTGRLVLVAPPMLRALSKSVVFSECSEPTVFLPSVEVEDHCMDRDEIQRLQVQEAIAFGIKGPNACPVPFIVSERVKKLRARSGHTLGRRCITCSQVRRSTNTGNVGTPPTIRDGVWWAGVRLTLKITPPIAGDEILLPLFQVDSKSKEIQIRGETIGILTDGSLGGVQKSSSPDIKIHLSKTVDHLTVQYLLRNVSFFTQVPNPSSDPRVLSIHVSFPANGSSIPFAFVQSIPIVIKKHQTPILLQGFKDPVQYRLRTAPKNPKIRYIKESDRKTDNALQIFLKCELIPQIHDIVDGGFLRVTLDNPQVGDHFGIRQEGTTTLITEMEFKPNSHIQIARNAIQSIVFYNAETKTARNRTMTLTTMLGNETQEQIATAHIVIEDAYIEILDDIQAITYIEKSGAVPIFTTGHLTTATVPSATFIVRVCDGFEDGDEVACILPKTYPGTVEKDPEPLWVCDKSIAVDTCTSYVVKGVRCAVYNTVDGTCYVRVGPPADRERETRTPSQGLIPAAVMNEILASFTYYHTSDNPHQAFKVLRVTILDQEWCESDAEISVRVVAVDDPTEIRGPSDIYYYQGSESALQGFNVAEELTLFDSDTDDYSGGFLKVDIFPGTTGLDPKDELLIRPLLLQDPADTTVFVDGDNMMYVFENRAAFDSWEERLVNNILRPNDSVVEAVKPVGSVRKAQTTIHMTFFDDYELTLKKLERLMRIVTFRNDALKCSTEDRIIRFSLNGGVSKETGFPSSPDTVRDVTLHVILAKVHIPGFVTSVPLRESPTVLFKSANVASFEGMCRQGCLRASIPKGYVDGDSMSIVLKGTGGLEVVDGKLTFNGNFLGSFTNTEKEIVLQFNENSKLDTKALQSVVRNIQFSRLPAVEATPSSRAGSIRAGSIPQPVAAVPTDRTVTLVCEGMWSSVLEGPSTWNTLSGIIRYSRPESDFTFKNAPDIESVYGTAVCSLAPLLEFTIPLDLFGTCLMRPPMTFTANLGGASFADKLSFFTDGMLRVEDGKVLYRGAVVATISQTDQKICVSFRCCPISVAQTLIRRLQYESSGKREKAGTKRPVTIAINVGETLPECSKIVGVLLGAPLIEGPSNGTFLFKGDKVPVFGPVRVRASYNFSGGSLLIDLQSTNPNESIFMSNHEELSVVMRSAEVGVVNYKGVRVGEVTSNDRTIQISFAGTGASSDVVTKCLQNVFYVQKDPKKDFSVTTMVDFTLTNEGGSRSCAQVKIACQAPPVKKK